MSTHPECATDAGNFGVFAIDHRSFFQIAEDELSPACCKAIEVRTAQLRRSNDRSCSKGR